MLPLLTHLVFSKGSEPDLCTQWGSSREHRTPGGFVLNPGCKATLYRVGDVARAFSECTGFNLSYDER